MYKKYIVKRVVKRSFLCSSFNIIYVVICPKTILSDWVEVYQQHIRQAE